MTASVLTTPDLALSLLDELPTSLIAQIVVQLHPRLYIDFIKYLPAEICLKIFTYLDPVSLISVARACRAWHDLALDRKLWEKLYLLEGWKAVDSEIKIWEEKVNKEGLGLSAGQLKRLTSSDESHTRKKRVISTSQTDHENDYVMVDAGRPLMQEPADDDRERSIFGGSGSGMTPDLRGLHMGGSGSSYDTGRVKSLDKGKGKEVTPAKVDTSSYFPPDTFSNEGSERLPKATLWVWDSRSSKYSINWKYMYSMRRRLESNWELGKFTNFQFPHPDHPEEGHSECIYSIQFNSKYLVSGSRDKTLRVWDMKTRRLVRGPITGHRGSVLCLQFDSDPDEDIIVSGSSDSDVIVWKFSTGQIIQRLNRAHTESVLNVKFDKRILVTCSKDKTIKIFNRRDLKAGDLGYEEVVVNPVPIHLKNYGYDGLDQLPIKPAWSMIGSLEGHGAAVNAVQISGREVVSASGDRHCKIWDWPNQTCLRTFCGHLKGIACVQYDGKRIVSGSSDNEVKIFDRQTGVELGSLRSHSQLVRTVQAGFADLPYSTEEDAAEAARVDATYFKAVETGQVPTSTPARRHLCNPGAPGSKRPEDIMAYGAKLPPGGGGGKYGRIVSGSYDTTIIIWRRDKEGIWKDQHRLKQEEAAAAAAENGRTVTRMPAAIRRPPPPPPPVTASQAGPSSAAPRLAPPLAQEASEGSSTDAPLTAAEIQLRIDNYVPQGVHVLQQALTRFPAMLQYPDELQAAISREQSPFVRSQLRQAVSTAQVRNQLREAREGTAAAAAASSSAQPIVAAGTSGAASAAEANPQPEEAAPPPVVVNVAVAGPPPNVPSHHNAPAARQVRAASWILTFEVAGMLTVVYSCNSMRTASSAAARPAPLWGGISAMGTKSSKKCASSLPQWNRARKASSSSQKGLI
jgi:F-box and WD-40 domain protein 1/11